MPLWCRKTLLYIRDLIAAAHADSHEARLRVQAHELLPRIEACEACEACNGSGVVHERDCDECDGEGEFDHGSHTYVCKNCEGTGDIDADPSPGEERTCWACDGLKIGGGEKPTPGIGRGQLRLASHCAALICTHVPDAEIRAIPEGEKGFIYFRSATQNVFGVVMPILISLARADELDRAVDWRAD